MRVKNLIIQFISIVIILSAILGLFYALAPQSLNSELIEVFNQMQKNNVTETIQKVYVILSNTSIIVYKNLTNLWVLPDLYTILVCVQLGFVCAIPLLKYSNRMYPTYYFLNIIHITTIWVFMAGFLH